jgi:hypothetical protein
MASYEPGVCNIGESERRKRYGLGAVGMAATLVLVFVVFAFDAPRPLLLSAAVPLFGAALGYFQGRLNFCVNYGLRGLVDAGVAGDGTRAVSDEAARRADRRRARQVVGYAAAVAVAGAVVVFGVGVLAA